MLGWHDTKLLPLIFEKHTPITFEKEPGNVLLPSSLIEATIIIPFETAARTVSDRV